MAKFGMLRNTKTLPGNMDSRSVRLTVKDIPVGDIEIKENVRREYNDIDDLAESIRQHGLLQPITVYPDGDGYIVKTGHRRYMACAALYRNEPDRFHSVRCIVSDASNVAVVQLVENLQRVDLSQLDLFNAMAALRDQDMILKQIAEATGKTEGYIKSLFVGINEIVKDEDLVELIGDAGITIRDIAETSTVTDKKERLNLLEQRKAGTMNRAEMRKKVWEFKTPKLKTEPPPKITLMLHVFADLNEIIIKAADEENKNRLAAVGKELQAFITGSDKYCLAEKTAQNKLQGVLNEKRKKRYQ
jgi:ParB family chromosome partitioning protein